MNPKHLDLIYKSCSLESKYNGLKIKRAKIIVKLLKEQYFNTVSELEKKELCIKEFEVEQTNDKNEIENCLKQIEKLKKDKEKFIAEHKKIQEMYLDLKKELFNKQKEIQEFCKNNKETEKLKNEVFVKQNEIEDLSKNNKETKKENEKLKKEINKLIKKKKEVVESKNDVQIENYKTENQDLIDNNKKLYGEIKALKHKNISLEKLNLELENEIFFLNKQFQNQETFEIFFKDLNNKIEQIKDDIQDKNNVICEEIKLFKKNFENIPRTNNEDNLKDNTIKILKESLKIKDKILAEKTVKIKDERVEQESNFQDDTIIYKNDIETQKPVIKKSKPSQKSKIFKIETDNNAIKDEKEHVNNIFKPIKKNKKKTKKVKIATDDLDKVVKQVHNETSTAKTLISKPSGFGESSNFFANLSFTDSSPVVKKYNKKY